MCDHKRLLFVINKQLVYQEVSELCYCHTLSFLVNFSEIFFMLGSSLVLFRYLYQVCGVWCNRQLGFILSRVNCHNV